MKKPRLLEMSDAVRASFEPVMKALGPVRQALAAERNVATVRPGYYYPDAGKPVPALVVAVVPGTSPVKAAELEKKFGVAFTVTDATVEEQLAAANRAGPVSFGTAEGPTVSTFEKMLGGEEAIEFGPPKTGSYEGLKPPKLTLVKEKMELTICVSPEAGWSELETFLGATEKRLTVAMYQFTAPHIFKAISEAVAPTGREFELVLHPIPEKPPKSGVKAHDLDEQDEVIDPLAKELKDRFEMAWATLISNAHPDGLWASAYHIKVAVRDSSAVWLSSGNWQSSNQPDVHPFAQHADKLPAGFQRKYNRDYHAIIANDTLASIYETYIKRDFELASVQAGQAVSFAAPDLFVPEEEPEEPVEFAAPPQLFQPLRLNRVVSVQPLLTPDNYAENALKLIQSAEKSVWFQNQYINFRGTSDDFAEFRLLIGALKDKIDAGVEVRIICRDMMKEESLDVLVAMGFPREVFRFQPACHNKTIIVDGKIVMFGSHNWSNEGVKTNRDASLIFDDEEIAAYLAQVYDYDWNRLATAHPAQTRPRVASDGEETPSGMKRVPFSAVFDD
jgi:PLD-like domain